MKIRRRQRARWTAASLAALTDEALIAHCITAIDDRTILKDGDFTFEKKRKRGTTPEAMHALIGEVQRRGIPWSVVGQRLVSQAMAGRLFTSDLFAPTPAKRYETRAAHALIQLMKRDDAPIEKYEFDAQVVGKITGHPRQIDLQLTGTRNGGKHVVACEFKHYRDRLVPVGEMSEFAVTLADVGADRGCFVVPRGYQRGAAQVAKHYGIHLFVFRETTVDGSPQWSLEDQQGHSWCFSESPER
jgi:hypothetical protein